MSRPRKKPEQSFLARAKYELEHADELLAERLKELKRIRAEKNAKLSDQTN